MFFGNDIMVEGQDITVDDLLRCILVLIKGRMWVRDLSEGGLYFEPLEL